MAKSWLNVLADLSYANFDTRCSTGLHDEASKSGSDVKLPTYDEIARDRNQLDVFETPTDRSLFVAGPPGSGKTTLAIHRAQIAARLGSRVALITYNRMLRRLVALATDGQIEAQTMHKFVWDTYQRLVNEPPPQIEPYVQNWSAMRMELNQKRIEPQPIHVIVDEGQDLPHEFYRFLRDFVAEGITVFADEDQTIDNNGSSLSEIKVAGRFDRPLTMPTERVPG